MQYKTLASAVEAIMNNECSIKNDDVPSLQRACKYVWPDDAEPEGDYEFYFNYTKNRWSISIHNPCPHFITATEFCRLMDNEVNEVEPSVLDLINAEFDRLEKECEETIEGLESRKMEGASACSSAMLFAYKNSRKIVTKLLPETRERGITITNVSKKPTSIDLGKVFDENASDYRPSYFNGRVITREKFIEIVTELLTEKNRK